PPVTPTVPLAAPDGTGATMRVSVQLAGVDVTPLKLTVLPPCVPPKFAPLIVTPVPARAASGESFVITGGMPNSTALLARPLTVTTTLPVPAPTGTGTLMLPSLQLVGVPATPLNVTVLLPCVAPNPAPTIATTVPARPNAGESVEILGPTTNGMPLLPNPPTETTTGPVVAPAGTGALIVLAVQAVGVAMTPLNATLLLPRAVPKFVPAIVTAVPRLPDVGEMLEMRGGTVNVAPLLATPAT